MDQAEESERDREEELALAELSQEHQREIAEAKRIRQPGEHFVDALKRAQRGLRQTLTDLAHRQFVATTGRSGMWMQTFSGVAWYHADPRPEDVCIEDIAHGLSLICRFGGQCNRFYSVAEHSVLVSWVLRDWGFGPNIQLLGLMHDATEAYVVDVPRPLKRLLGESYSNIESATWRAIAAKFDLLAELPEIIHTADNAMLLSEKTVLLGPSPQPWTVPGKAADRKPLLWTSLAAEVLFRGEFDRLMKEVSP